MILAPRPLQKPASRGTPVLPQRGPGTPRSASSARPVLPVTLRMPQQLCLDLRPR